MKALRYILWVLGVLAAIYAIWFGGLGRQSLSELEDDGERSEVRTPAAVSLFGTPLYAEEPTGESGQRMRAQLAEAVAMHEADPRSVDGFVWYGRRLAYLGRYAEAIRVYTDGLAVHPNEPHLLRHRGHRFITIRRIDDAADDLTTAARIVEGAPDEVEPDGQPNAAGIPTSTLQTNIWYHLGLVRYIQGDFESSAAAFQVCFDLATNDDMRVAAADWLYMSLRRAGREVEASEAIAFVTNDMELLENQAYYDRLRMYRGFLEAESLESDISGPGDAISLATLGYGVGNWYLMEGDTTGAVELFKRVLETGIWQAFGFIAAEADLARLN